jgi:hypothetical protein
MKTHLSGEARIGQRARRDRGVVDLHVVRHLLGAEADGVHRNPAAAQSGNRIEIDPAGIVRAVAQQHHRADRQISCFAASCFRPSPMRVAGSGRRTFQIVEFRDARDLAVEAVEANLKFLLQLVEHAAFERFDGLRFACRATVVRDGHAARIVHQHRDDVLLRPQLGHQDGRLPQ